MLGRTQRMRLQRGSITANTTEAIKAKLNTSSLNSSFVFLTIRNSDRLLLDFAGAGQFYTDWKIPRTGNWAKIEIRIAGDIWISSNENKISPLYDGLSRISLSQSKMCMSFDRVVLDSINTKLDCMRCDSQLYQDFVSRCIEMASVVADDRNFAVIANNVQRNRICCCESVIKIAKKATICDKTTRLVISESLKKTTCATLHCKSARV